MERAMTQVDFTPSSDMFDQEPDTKQDENQSNDTLERASDPTSENDEFGREAELVMENLVNVQVHKPDVLKEPNRDISKPVYKEDNQAIVGDGVPKINIAPGILEAAKKGNRGEWRVEFEVIKCERATDDYVKA
jgi:hypothetical protein